MNNLSEDLEKLLRDYFKSAVDGKAPYKLMLRRLQICEVVLEAGVGSFVRAMEDLAEPKPTNEEVRVWLRNSFEGLILDNRLELMRKQKRVLECEVCGWPGKNPCEMCGSRAKSPFLPITIVWVWILLLIVVLTAIVFKH